MKENVKYMTVAPYKKKYELLHGKNTWKKLSSQEKADFINEIDKSGNKNENVA